MERMKGFLLGTLKIAAAIILAAITITVCVKIWEAFEKGREQSQNAPLAEPKRWPTISIEALDNAKLKLVTMWRDGRLYFQFEIEGGVKPIKAARSSRLLPARDKYNFSVSFKDLNGFEIFKEELLLKDLVGNINNKGEERGYSLDGNFLMDAKDYRQAQRWDVSFSFPLHVDVADQQKPRVVDEKPKFVEARWRNLALWRQLNRQMSKSDVQLLLGPPTKIDDAGVLVFWYYGYPVGGQVTFNDRGGIHSWREP